MTVRLEKLKLMRAAHVHVLSETPKEDANRKLMGWAERNGVVKQGARLFGRNTYPTDNLEPHGYEFFLTIAQDVKSKGDVDLKEITGGSYAVLRFTSLEKIGEAWQKLWKWFEESKREQTGFRKEEHG
jgi:DNA gyrase inhibitor GyrI